jgi:hypothetical protein
LGVHRSEGIAKGRLIDLDLRKELKSAPSRASYQAGTLRLMVIEVLQGKGHLSAPYCVICLGFHINVYSIWQQEPEGSRKQLDKASQKPTGERGSARMSILPGRHTSRNCRHRARSHTFLLRVNSSNSEATSTLLFTDNIESLFIRMSSFLRLSSVCNKGLNN